MKSIPTTLWLKPNGGFHQNSTSLLPWLIMVPTVLRFLLLLAPQPLGCHEFLTYDWPPCNMQVSPFMSEAQERVELEMAFRMLARKLGLQINIFTTHLFVRCDAFHQMS